MTVKVPCVTIGLREKLDSFYIEKAKGAI